MLVCKAFYTSLALQFPPHNILNVMYCLSGGNKRKKRECERGFHSHWYDFLMWIHCIFSRKAIAALSYFSRDFWRGLEIASLLLESYLMISFQISVSYFFLIYVLLLAYLKRLLFNLPLLWVGLSTSENIC